jgi:para-aminobenzoate synthetase
MGDATGAGARVLRYWAADKRLSILEDGRETTQTGDVLDLLDQELCATTLSAPAVPFDLPGGYVGFLGYELLSAGLAGRHVSDLPDAGLVRVDRMVVFDHQEESIWLACCLPESDVAGAESWIDRMEAELFALPEDAPLGAPAAPSPVRLSLRHAPADYLAMIRRCQRLIGDGESYEMCLTNQLRAALDLDPLRYYRALRRGNPAPFAAYLSFPDDLVVASSSPELYLAVGGDGHVEAKPMKGTARRSADPAEDARVKQALRDDEKTRSENLMIVDLVRNDLGRVCEVGSVHVPKLMPIETYASVHQMVSTIEGHLRPGASVIDVIRASFPGGSMTGAPKVRTMEMLEALEQGPRGIYAGAIGFFGYTGVARLSIVIRTAVIAPGLFTVGTGGAIVALSDPEAELDETFVKLEPMVRALAEATGNDPQALVQTLWSMRREPSSAPTASERSPDRALAELRRAIDDIDADLLAVLARRLGLCAEVAALKKANDIPMMQPARVELVLGRRAAEAPRYGLRSEFVRRLYGMIIEEACHLEDDIIDGRAQP